MTHGKPSPTLQILPQADSGQRISASSARRVIFAFFLAAFAAFGPFAFDSRGNVVSSTDQRGKVTAFVYDDNSQLVRREDPDGAVWRFQYDSAGREWKVVDARGACTEKLYTSDGLLESARDKNGRVTRFTYDGSRRAFALDSAPGGSYAFLPEGQEAGFPHARLPEA